MNSLPYTVRLWFPTRRVEATTEVARPNQSSTEDQGRVWQGWQHRLKDVLRNTLARATEVSLRWRSKRRSLRLSFSNANAYEFQRKRIREFAAVATNPEGGHASQNIACRRVVDQPCGGRHTGGCSRRDATTTDEYCERSAKLAHDPS